MKRIGIALIAIAAAAQAAQQTLSLTIEGWHSKGDVYKTEQAVQKLKGVVRVSSDLPGKRLTVVYDDGAASPAAIEKAISAAGYVSRR
ncbi:MAG TPA: heavy-metal-associated domain-containing protein [Myxococcales bacterium]|nr:heavy-metal-associated domain-containing protein [Myxococcales bacterium]